jgi:hypothetical protein
MLPCIISSIHELATRCNLESYVKYDVGCVQWYHDIVFRSNEDSHNELFRPAETVA